MEIRNPSYRIIANRINKNVSFEDFFASAVEDYGGNKERLQAMGKKIKLAYMVAEIADEVLTEFPEFWYPTTFRQEPDYKKIGLHTTGIDTRAKLIFFMKVLKNLYIADFHPVIKGHRIDIYGRHKLYSNKFCLLKHDQD